MRLCLALLLASATIVDAEEDIFAPKSLNDGDWYRTQYSSYSTLLSVQHRLTESRALAALLKGLQRPNETMQQEDDRLWGNRWVESRFADVVVALHLPPEDLKKLDDKSIVAPDAIQLQGANYTVYAAGMAGQPNFENLMSGLGAAVYAFDCTDKKRWGYNFNFYDWCIGKSHSFEGSVYAHGTDTGQQFYSLGEIKEKLGHKKIDMLKMDIEGFEWGLLEAEVLGGRDEDLPHQLLVEVHTEGATEKYVPVDLVLGKRTRQVNELVLALWRRGYRLVDKVINNGVRNIETPTPIVCSFPIYLRSTNPTPHTPNTPKHLYPLYRIPNIPTIPNIPNQDPRCADLTFLLVPKLGSHHYHHFNGGNGSSTTTTTTITSTELHR
jgi:hypothetical protein